MAKVTFAQFRAKTVRNLDLVVKDAAQTTFAKMTERQPSIRETGSFEVGKVPVDTGFLINSQKVEINGSEVGAGEGSYVGAIAGLELGDTVSVSFTAPYARKLEYGTATMPGRFFVRQAVAGWQGAVDQAARKFGDA